MIETIIYRNLARPVIMRHDSETMHHWVRDKLGEFSQTARGRKILEVASGQYFGLFEHPMLEVEDRGVKYRNFLESAGGYDKPGKAQRGLATLGCGATHVGGITLKGQIGNEQRPRQHTFIGKNGLGVGCLNDLGFPNEGVNVAVSNLIELYLPVSQRNYKILGNIGYGKDTDVTQIPNEMGEVAFRLAPLVDEIEDVPSCPNVHHSKEFIKCVQDYYFIKDVAQAGKDGIKRSGRDISLNIKVPGDSTIEGLENTIRVALEEKVGLTVSNTTTDHTIKSGYGSKWETTSGGYSGQHPKFRRRVTEMIAFAYNQSEGKVPIKASGGTWDFETSEEKVEAGAIKVQIMTAFLIMGPAVVTEIKKDWVNYLKSEGCKSYKEKIGISAKKYDKLGYPNIPRDY